MPQLGETVAEGKIVKWFKAAGDAVKPRKVTSIWYGLPAVSLTLTLPADWFSASVRFSARHLCTAYIAASARSILDHDGLPRQSAKFAAHDSRHGVGGPACGKGNNHLQATRRKLLCLCSDKNSSEL